MITLSIIIPVYNTEKFLPKCLESIFQCSLQNYEIIVVDDCSQGNCRQIVEIYQNKYNNVQLIHHHQNQGSLASRLTGINAANGFYCIHLDPDDYIENNIYQLAYEYGISKNADIVFFNTLEEDSNNRYIYEYNIFEKQDNLSGKDIIKYIFYSLSIKWQWHSLCNKLVKTKYYKDILHHFQKSPHLVLGEDLLLSFTLYLHLYDKNHMYTLVDQGLVYQRHSNSITITENYPSKIKKSFDVLYVMRYIKKIFKKFQLYSYYKSEIKKLIHHISAIHFMHFPNLSLIKYLYQYMYIKSLYILTLNKYGLLKINEKKAAKILLQKIQFEKLDSISIFGTGSLAKELVSLLKTKNIEINCLISTKVHNKLYKGIPIITPIEAIQLNKKNVVIASIDSYFVIKLMLEEKVNYNMLIVTL